MSAIRDSIYNNYLQTYSSSTTRFDSHKKSELRNTYNSIVKLNKEDASSFYYLGNCFEKEEDENVTKNLRDFGEEKDYKFVNAILDNCLNE